MPDESPRVIIRVDNMERLTTGQVSEIIELSRRTTLADEVAPLSEQALLAVSAGATPAATDRHFLTYAGAHLAGYAHLERGAARQPGTAELMVDPSYRRQGLGAALVRALENTALADAQAPRGGALQIWSHGDLDGARALALRHGYSKVRELWQMRRSLRPDAALPEISLPEGFRTRHFVSGQDEQAWLRVNSRAFADHPEQGRMTRHDLDQRIAQRWFDARGLLLIEDTRGRLPVLAASHWTKVVPVDEPEVIPAHPCVGEVYVVAVDPAYQGLGLGRAVTVLGLAHLRARGLAEAMLYVDADNHAAVATYSRLDFTRVAVDIMYSRTVHPPV